MARTGFRSAGAASPLRLVAPSSVHGTGQACLCCGLKNSARRGCHACKVALRTPSVAYLLVLHGAPVVRICKRGMLFDSGLELKRKSPKKKLFADDLDNMVSKIEDKVHAPRKMARVEGCEPSRLLDVPHECMEPAGISLDVPIGMYFIRNHKYDLAPKEHYPSGIGDEPSGYFQGLAPGMTGFWKL